VDIFYPPNNINIIVSHILAHRLGTNALREKKKLKLNENTNADFIPPHPVLDKHPLQLKAFSNPVKPYPTQPLSAPFFERDTQGSAKGLGERGGRSADIAIKARTDCVAYYSPGPSNTSLQ